MGDFENAFDAINKPMNAAMKAAVVTPVTPVPVVPVVPVEKITTSADKTGQPANAKAAAEVAKKSAAHVKGQEKK